MGETNTWFTPWYILEALGEFDLDPCTESFRPFDTARKHYCHDLGQDGFSASWEGRVWLNPPYGKETGAWLERLADHGNGVALVFARTDTLWAQTQLKRAGAVNFMRGRVAFIRRDGKKASTAGTGSMLLAFGENNIGAIHKISGIVFSA